MAGPSAINLKGLDASKPAAGIAGRLYFATDTLKVYYDNGTTWDGYSFGGSGVNVTTKGDLQGFSSVAGRVPVGTNGQVLTANSSATFGLDWETPSAGGAAPSVLLAFEETTDVASGAATSTSYSDLGVNHNFTVANAGSTVMIFAGGNAQLNGAEGGARINVDSGGTPITKVISGCSAGNNIFGGSRPVYLTGLTAAVHTVKVQVVSAAAGTIYCRVATQTGFESMTITVVEFLP